MNNTASKPETPQNSWQVTDADLDRLIHFVHTNYGIDLNRKRQLIAARLATDVKHRGYRSFEAFVDHLLVCKDQSELTFLLDKLTTNYTFFMREYESLEYLRDKIIPEIVRKHQRDKSLAIWSAGCASGEEPYNISMYLLDYLGDQAKNWDTRVLATDISSQALAAARRGIYHLPDEVSEEWRRKYFTPEPDGTYAVAPALRNNVDFRTFNLMDPIRFRTKFDVIFCRNVMIYFDQPTREGLVRRFCDATVPGGYLVISCSENLGLDIPYRKVSTAIFQK